MSKSNIKNCLLCDSVQLKHLYTCTDFYSSGEQFELFKCEKCGFIFTQNFPEGNTIDKYYDSSEYISHTDTKKGLVNSLYHRVRRHMLRKKVQLVTRESHRKTGKILDIGTGTGYFPAIMKKTGWEVEAVEKNKDARALACNKFQLDVKEESALENYTGETFDVITLWHVLEHMENPDKVWNTLYRLLDEKGVLIIAVPNAFSYDACKYGANWAAFDVPRHLWHYTPGTMQRWGSKYGFKLVNRHPMPFDAFYVSLLSEKNKMSSMPFIKGMYTGVIAWFHALLKKDRSSSMIYIFRKKQNEKQR